jgi:hypothetical protein
MTSIGDIVFVASDDSCFSTNANFEYFESVLKPLRPNWFRGIVPHHDKGVIVAKLEHGMRPDRKAVLILQRASDPVSHIAVDATGVEPHLRKGSDVIVFSRSNGSERWKRFTSLANMTFKDVKIVPTEACRRCRGVIERISIIEKTCESICFAYLVRVSEKGDFAAVHGSELVRTNSARKSKRYGDDELVFRDAHGNAHVAYRPDGVGRDQFAGMLSVQNFELPDFSLRSLIKVVPFSDADYSY